MTKKRCDVWWCDKPHYANGYCKAHDIAMKRYGSPFGKSAKKWERVNDEIIKARLIAIRVTEFVGETEDSDDSVAVTQFSELAHSIRQCPFCGQLKSHSPLCIVNLSKSLLKETYPYGDD